MNKSKYARLNMNDSASNSHNRAGANVFMHRRSTENGANGSNAAVYKALREHGLTEVIRINKSAI